MDGIGVYQSSDGMKYEGEWKSGQKEGKGRLANQPEAPAPAKGETTNQSKQFSNGDSYEGDWCDGRMNGYGIYRYANGDTYKGDWVNGINHGKGVYTR